MNSRKSNSKELKDINKLIEHQKEIEEHQKAIDEKDTQIALLDDDHGVPGRV